MKNIIITLMFLICFLPVSVKADTVIQMDNLINEGETLEKQSEIKTKSTGMDRNYEETLKNDILEHKDVINTVGYGLTASNVQSEITAFINRNPELFFLDGSFSVAKDSSGNVNKLKFVYTYDKETTAKMLKEVEEESSAFLDSIDWSSLTDAEKVLLVHDFVGTHIVYSSNTDNAYNLYGALVERKAVCQGYAQAESYLLNQLGVVSGVATSMKLSHAWDVVKVDGKWYHSDPTFDGDGYNPGSTKHRYVLISSKKLYENDEETTRNDYTTTIKNSSETFSEPTDTSYENMYWLKSESKILYHNGKWYYTTDNGIVERGSGEKTIWNNPLNLWMDDVHIGLLDSMIYFAGGESIYKLNPSTYQVSEVMTYPNRICGINVYHSSLEYLDMTEDERLSYPILQNISNYQIVLSADSLEYTGGETKPSVTLKNGNITIPSSCYQITFKNSNKIGTATVTVTGLGNYSGSVSKSYSIVHTTHTYDNGKVIKEPTCTNSGTKQYTCTLCGATKETRTLALGHNYIEERKEATCTSDGFIRKVCSRCNKVTETSIPALGHDTKLVNQKEASYEENGYTGDTVCNRCNTVISKGSVIPSIGHHYDAGTIIKKAGCETHGIMEYHCQDEGCNYFYQINIPATGHQTSLQNKKDASCLAEGYSGDRICSICKKTVGKGSVIAKLDHQYEKVSETEATCEKAGNIRYQCKLCKQNKTETIPTKGHHLVKIKETEATCDKTGAVEYQCSVCKKTIKNTIPTKEHQFTAKSKTNMVNKTGYKQTTKTTWDECICGEITNKKVQNSYKLFGTKINKASYKKGKSIIKWSKVKGVNYQLQYSKKKNMKKAKTIKTKINSKKLKGKWYIRVRTYKKINGKVYYSNWSPVKKSK